MKLFFTFLISCFFICNALFAATKTSAGSGNWSTPGIWSPSGVPAFGDIVIIASPCTVTLDIDATVSSINIQNGAILTNNNTKKISFNSSNITNYINNGIHNVTGGGTAIFHNTTNCSLDGNGIINGNILVESGSLFFLSSCHITINGDMKTTGNSTYSIINNGFDTLNGNLELFNGNGTDFTNNGSLTQSGNTTIFNSIWFYNYGIFSTTGDLVLYDAVYGGSGQFAIFQNFSTARISGDVKGNGGACMFIQESGAIAKFGGQVFPFGFDGQLCTVGISPFSGVSVEPNTVEYNGSANQLIKTPCNDSVLVTDIWSGGPPYDFSPNTYSNLIISNTNTKTLRSYLTINGNLTIQNTATLDVSASNYNLDIKGNWTNNSSNTLTERAGTVALSSSSTQSITDAGGETFYNLTLSGSSTKTLGGNITVNGNLSIQNIATLDVSATPFNIDLKGNWVNSTTSSLTERTGTVTLSGGSAQTITANSVSGGETFYNLTNANTAGNVSLNDDITVNGTLHFTSGKFILGTKNLTLSTPTAITGYSTSNYVVTDSIGYLQINGITTPAFEFPIGISTSSYTPANIINNGAGATATNFSARVANKVYSSQGNVQVADMVDRTWYITGSGGTANATLTLQWNVAEEFGTFDRTNCGISHYSVPNWDVPPTFGAATGIGPYTQSRSGISTFSPFAVEAVTHPLPIELMSFTGELNADGQVLLNWTTVTETNNDFFTVERVTPTVLQTSPPPAGGGDTTRINFIPIGIVKGAGNSAMPINYHLLDEAPSPKFIPTKEGERTGVRYYRLKQTDYDGKFSYSPLISIEIKNNRMFSMYPNPAVANVNLNINSEKEETLVLSVLDNLGRIITAKEENMIEGQNYFKIDVSSINAGTYVLQMITASGVVKQMRLMIK